MKKFLFSLIIFISSFMIYKYNVNAANGYDWANINNYSLSCYYNTNCSSITTKDTISYFDFSSSSTQYEFEFHNFNSSNGIYQPNSNAIAFLIPFTLQNMNKEKSLTCSNYNMQYIYLPQSFTTTYADSSQSYSYFNGGTSNSFNICDKFRFYEDNSVGLNISYVYERNDNTYRLPCTILGNGVDMYAYCPLDGTNAKITYFTFMFTTDDDSVVDQYRFTWNSNRVIFELDYTKSIFDKISEFSSNSTTISNNTTEIKNDIKDSSIDNNNTSSSANSWSSKNATNGTITNLLTLPISLLQNILNGIQTTCTNFSLGTLFGTELVLPCINLSNLIGSTLFGVIDLLFSGFMILNISKKLIKIFNDFTNLKSNQIDEIYSNGGGSN